MLRRRLQGRGYAAAFVAVLTCCTEESATESPPVIPLSTEAARGLFNSPCVAPPRHTSLWTPSDEMIAELDRSVREKFDALPEDVWTRSRSEDRPQHKGYDEYVRQVVGYVEHGKKRVYVNGFYRDRIPKGVDPRVDYLAMCDGGTANWGARWDLESRSFLAGSFSGPNARAW